MFVDENVFKEKKGKCGIVPVYIVVSGMHRPFRFRRRRSILTSLFNVASIAQDHMLRLPYGRITVGRVALSYFLSLGSCSPAYLSRWTYGYDGKRTL